MRCMQHPQPQSAHAGPTHGPSPWALHLPCCCATQPCHAASRYAMHTCHSHPPTYNISSAPYGSFVAHMTAAVCHITACNSTPTQHLTHPRPRPPSSTRAHFGPLVAQRSAARASMRRTAPAPRLTSCPSSKTLPESHPLHLLTSSPRTTPPFAQLPPRTKYCLVCPAWQQPAAIAPHGEGGAGHDPPSDATQTSGGWGSARPNFQARETFRG